VGSTTARPASAANPVAESDSGAANTAVVAAISAPPRARPGRVSPRPVARMTTKVAPNTIAVAMPLTRPIALPAPPSAIRSRPPAMAAAAIHVRSGARSPRKITLNSAAKIDAVARQPSVSAMVVCSTVKTNRILLSANSKASPQPSGLRICAAMAVVRPRSRTRRNPPRPIAMAMPRQNSVVATSASSSRIRMESGLRTSTPVPVSAMPTMRGLKTARPNAVLPAWCRRGRSGGLEGLDHAVNELELGAGAGIEHERVGVGQAHAAVDRVHADRQMCPSVHEGVEVARILLPRR